MEEMRIREKKIAMNRVFRAEMARKVAEEMSEEQEKKLKRIQKVIAMRKQRMMEEERQMQMSVPQSSDEIGGIDSRQGTRIASYTLD